MGRLKELNPYATLSCETSSAELTTDELKGFTMVCASSTSMAKLGAVNDVCRGAGVPFLGIGSMGGAAFAFVDLLEHEYEEIKVSKEEDKDKRKRSEGNKIAKRRETEEQRKTEEGLVSCCVKVCLCVREPKKLLPIPVGAPTKESTFYLPREDNGTYSTTVHTEVDSII